MKHFSGDIGQSVPTTVVEVRQLLVVNAKQMQHRGVQIKHRNAIRDSAEADFIEFTVTGSPVAAIASGLSGAISSPASCQRTNVLYGRSSLSERITKSRNR